VIHAGHPKNVVAFHALVAADDVVGDGVHDVAEVELAGDVRRRNDHREGLLREIARGEIAGLDPALVLAFFDFFVIVMLV
jgi:hypothetical protein